MKLVVGLGNPGRSYQWTRHNTGFLIIETLARQRGIGLDRRGMKCLYGQGRIGPEEVILAKPLTYMNLSGEAVSWLLRSLSLSPGDLVVLHDDLDLPVGRIRIRWSGGHGGHQGVKSIIESVGTGHFLRLKMGIGRPAGRSDQEPADYVLEPLAGREKEEFQAAVLRGAEAAGVLLLEGPEEAMNRFHQDSPDPESRCGEKREL